MQMYKVSDDGSTVVDPNYYYKPIETCPKGVNVWLLTKYGIGVVGNYTGQVDIIGWCPKPKIPSFMKELMK